MIVVVRIGHLSTFYHASFVLMASTGVERELGDTCEWTLFGTGPEMVRAFEKGELDVGYMGLPPAVIGISQGVPIRCVAAGHVEGTVMVSREPVGDDPLDEGDLERVLRSFSGRTIGTTTKGSIHDVILAHYLDKFDLAEAVNVEHYNQAEFIAMGLASGTIQAGVGTPALLVFAKTLGPAHLAAPPSLLWPGNPSYGLFFHDSFSTGHLSVARVFAGQHARAVQFIKEKPREAAERVASIVKVADAAFIEAVMRISPKYFSDITSEFVEATMSFARELHALGYVDRVPGAGEIFQDIGSRIA